MYTMANHLTIIQNASRQIQPPLTASVYVEAVIRSNEQTITSLMARHKEDKEPQCVVDVATPTLTSMRSFPRFPIEHPQLQAFIRFLKVWMGGAGHMNRPAPLQHPCQRSSNTWAPGVWTGTNYFSQLSSQNTVGVGGGWPGHLLAESRHGFEVFQA